MSSEQKRTDVPDEGIEAVENGSGIEAGENPDDSTVLDGQIEAVLFSMEVPLTTQKLSLLLGVRKPALLEAIDRLNVFYAETSRAFRITPLAGGYQLVTTAEHVDLLGKLHKERLPTRLSRAALETLSIIAFKQPVMRVEIDGIRGVSASDRMLRHLIERRLVRIAGRAEAPGRPLLYGTTREFLEYFGLSAVADLPRTDELEALLAGDPPGSATESEESTNVGEVGGGEIAPVVQESDDSGADSGIIEDAEADGDAEADAPAGPIYEDSESHSGEESDDHEGIPSPQ